MEPETTRLKMALKASGETAKALAEATGVAYRTVNRYLNDPERVPPADFVRRAAEFLNVPVGWLHGYERALYELLKPETEEERQKVDFSAKLLRNFTPTEEAVFRSYLARWLKADWPEDFRERLSRMTKLWALLYEPPRFFGTEAAFDHPRQRTDYIVAMLHALGLVMPERP